jgi:enamine deaminase RidA (YjgF/YER057c/UK114 family)
VSITRIEPGARLSEAVVHGGLVYLAGHVSSDPSASVGDQTREILAEIDRHLALAGTSKSKLLTVSIWLADMSTFGELNAAWDAWVDPDAKPARATVEARLASADYKVEIAGIAAV